MNKKNNLLNINSLFFFIKTYGIIFFFIYLFRFIKLYFFKILNIQFIKKNIFNFSMFLNLNDPGISKALYLYEKRELELKYILDQFVKPGMNVYDIGSNIGYYVLIINDIIQNNGKIVSIEPSIKNYEILKKNLDLNKCNNVITFNVAISDINSKKKFYLSNLSNLNSFHNFGSISKHLSGEEIIVETFTIPELIKRTNIKPDIIRMDVEGHEVEVLNGMLTSLKDNSISPIIVFETHLTTYNPQHSINKILVELFKIGYKAKIVGSSQESGSKLLEKMGYHSNKSFLTDKVTRKIFHNIKDRDLLNLLESKGGIRSVLLSK